MGAQKRNKKYFYRKLVLLILPLVLLAGIASGIALSQNNSPRQLTIAAWDKLYLPQTEHLITPIKGILDAIASENYTALTSSCQQLGQDATRAHSWPTIPDQFASSHFSALINSFGQIAMDCQALTLKLQQQKNPQSAIKKMSSEMSFAAQEMKDTINILESPT